MKIFGVGAFVCWRTVVRRVLKFFFWFMNYYSWYIFLYNMGLVLTRNMIVYLWRTLKVMYPKKACYSYQISKMFSISKSKNSHFWGVQVLKTREYKSLEKSRSRDIGYLSLAIYDNTTSCSLWQNWPLGPDGLRLKTMK